MNRPLWLFAFLLLAAPARPATVTFAYTNWNNSTPTNSAVRIIPASSPMNDGNFITIGPAERLTLTNGVASKVMRKGAYQCIAVDSPPPNVIVIDVPDTSSNYFASVLAIRGLIFFPGQPLMGLAPGDNITFSTNNQILTITAQSGSNDFFRSIAGLGVTIATNPINRTYTISAPANVNALTNNDTRGINLDGTLQLGDGGFFVDSDGVVAQLSAQRIFMSNPTAQDGSDPQTQFLGWNANANEIGPMLNGQGLTNLNLTSAAHSNVLYVAKNGNDGTGTRNRLDKPWKQIRNAAAAAVAGDIIIASPGIYLETNVVILGTNVTLRAYGVVIKQDNLGVNGVTLLSGAGIYGATVIQTNTGFAYPITILNPASNGVTVADCRIFGNSDGIFLTGGTGNTFIRNNYIDSFFDCFNFSGTTTNYIIGNTMYAHGGTLLRGFVGGSPVAPTYLTANDIIIESTPGPLFSVGLFAPYTGIYFVNGGSIQAATPIQTDDPSRIEGEDPDPAALVYVDGTAFNRTNCFGQRIFRTQLDNAYRYVATNGNNVTAVANVKSLPWLTPGYAISNSAPGDTVLIGAGVWNQTNTIVIPRGVRVIGLGRQTIFTNWCNYALTDVLFQFSENSSLQSVTVYDATAGSPGVIKCPFGMVPKHGPGGQGVFLRDVVGYSVSDGFNIIHTNTCQATILESSFYTPWDKSLVVNVGSSNHVVNFVDCNLIHYAYGPNVNPGGFALNLQAQRSTINVYRGRFEIGGQIKPFAVGDIGDNTISNSTINFYGTSITNTGSGQAEVDDTLNNSANFYGTRALSEVAALSTVSQVPSHKPYLSTAYFEGPFTIAQNGAGAGKVWTATDSTGIGSWQPAAGGSSGISTNNGSGTNNYFVGPTITNAPNITGSNARFDNIFVTNGTVLANGTAGNTAAGIFYSDTGRSTLGGNNFVAGSSANTVGTGSDYCAIGGGQNSKITIPNADNDVIAGGANNVISGANPSSVDFSFIAGGSGNLIVSNPTPAVVGYAGILGGESNFVSASYSLVGGRLAQAKHQGSFLWADTQEAFLTSDRADQFKARAQGGFVFKDGAVTNTLGTTLWGASAAASYMYLKAQSFAELHMRQNGWIGFSTSGSDATAAGHAGLYGGAAAGVLQFMDNTDNAALMWYNWGGQARLTTNMTTTGTSLGTINMNRIVTLISGRAYKFRLVLFFNVALAADGIKIDFNGGSAGSTTFRAHGNVYGTTSGFGAQVTGLTGTIAGVALSTDDEKLEVDGYFVPSGNGTFRPRFAKNADSAGATLTIYAGSNFEVQDVP